MVHDRESIAQDLGLLHVVGREQDRPAARLHAEDEVPQRAPSRRIEAGGGLVEEHELGIVDEREGHAQALALAAGQDPGLGVAPLAQVERLDQLGGRAGVAVEAAEQVEDLGDRELRIEGSGLEAHPDPWLELVRAAGDIDPEHGDLAAVGRPKALEDLDRRGLAGAVGSEETEDLAGGDVEVDAGDRLDLVIALGQATHPDRRAPPDRDGHGAMVPQAAGTRGPARDDQASGASSGSLSHPVVQSISSARPASSVAAPDSGAGAPSPM